MNTAPQSVTERYITNLINYGRNREFDIVKVTRETTTVDDQQVGVWFSSSVAKGTDLVHDKVGCGATISQAVRRALEKHGVTFR